MVLYFPLLAVKCSPQNKDRVEIIDMDTTIEIPDGATLHLMCEASQINNSDLYLGVNRSRQYPSFKGTQDVS